MSRGSTRFFVVVEPTKPAVRTVEYALREARDWQTELGMAVTVEVRILVPTAGRSTGSKTKRRIETAIASFDAADLHTSVDFLEYGEPTPTDALLTHLADVDIQRVVLSAESDVSVTRLRDDLGIDTIERAPGDSTRSRRRLLHPGSLRRLLTVFGLTYLFYLALGGFTGGLDLLTGAISAGVVAVSLSHVALREEPQVSRTGQRLARMVAFLPVLLWEIAKANVSIAAIILHPRLPIDPSMDTIETDAQEGLEQMVLANSITLTPGTVTIDVRDREFTVHSLTADARSDLAGGRLQRLVAWVFEPGNAATLGDGGGDDQ